MRPPNRTYRSIGHQPLYVLLIFSVLVFGFSVQTYAKKYVYEADTLTKRTGRKLGLKGSQPRGTIVLGVNTPNINHFVFRPTGEGPKINAGFLGIGIHADYFHQKNRFIRAMGAMVMDFPAPAPAPIKRVGGEFEDMNSMYVGLTHNHHQLIPRFGHYFTYGYGLSYGRNQWRYQDLGGFENGQQIPPTNESLDKAHSVAGLLFNISVLPRGLNRQFIAGMDYRPTFWRFGTDSRWAYEHHLGLYIGFKFKVR